MYACVLFTYTWDEPRQCQSVPVVVVECRTLCIRNVGSWLSWGEITESGCEGGAHYTPLPLRRSHHKVPSMCEAYPARRTQGHDCLGSTCVPRFVGCYCFPTFHFGYEMSSAAVTCTFGSISSLPVLLTTEDNGNFLTMLSCHVRFPSRMHWQKKTIRIGEFGQVI